MSTRRLPGAFRELVIIRVALLNGAQYEADVHAPIARKERMLVSLCSISPKYSPLVFTVGVRMRPTSHRQRRRLNPDEGHRRRPSPTHDEIAQLAFSLYESRGRQDGH